MREMKPKVAILDMNNQFKNQGLRCIRDIVKRFDNEVEWEIFDVRAKNEIPDLSYDIYISSGGPGSPLEKGTWRKPYFKLINDLITFNAGESPEKKHMFLICYSFQLMCNHLKLGKITKRKSTSFGVLPIHKTKFGRLDPVLADLPDPYHAVDSRDWQVIHPVIPNFRKLGAKILSLESIRTHIEFERAIMAIRFNPTMIGTQFHPEADPEGMKNHLNEEENKQTIIRNFDLMKYESTLRHLDDPDKIKLTQDTILPTFIRNCLTSIKTCKEELQLL